MAFVSGQFQSFRAIKTVHLGSIQKDIVADTIVQFDGQKVRFGDEEKSLPELSAAIRVGWLVPASDTTSVYKPQPAGVEIRKADSRGDTREVVRSTTIVAADERDVGSVADVRAEGTPPTHTATRAGEISRKASLPVSAQPSDEGTVVSRFKTPTKFSGTTVDGVNDARVVNGLDNNASPTWERVAKPLEGQLVGDNLSDLLPDAPTSRTPTPGPAGEGSSIASADDRARGAVTFSAGASSVGDADDGVVVGKVGSAPEAPSQPAEEPTPEAITAAKLEVIRMMIPDFDWDFKKQWRARVKDILELRVTDKIRYGAVLSIETEAVRKHVLQATSAEG